MSKSHRGLLLVVAGAVLLAVAFAVVYFTVLAPRSEKKRVQREVDAWSGRWAKARACVVGAKPRSSDGYEAVILNEALSSENMAEALRGCADEMRVLRRGEGYNAGAEVEEAWKELEKKVDDVIVAHALRTATRPAGVPSDLRRGLADAVEAVDQAHARLRERADMDAQHLPGQRLPVLSAGRVLADANGKPLVPESVGVGGSSVLYAFGSVDDRRWLVRQANSAAPQIIPLGTESLAAIDGSGWGLWIEEAEEDGLPSEVRAGPLDALGDPAADGVIIHKLPVDEEAELHFALAAGDVRVALYMVTSARDPIGSEWLARSRDGGATWPERRKLTDDASMRAHAAVDPVAQRIDLAWISRSGPMSLVADPATAAGPLLPSVDAVPGARVCIAGSLTWLLASGGPLYVADGSGTPPHVVPGSARHIVQAACGGDRLIGIVDADDASGGGVLVCRPSSCVATALASASGLQGPLLVSDRTGPTVALEEGGIVILWTGDPEKKEAFAPTRIVRLAGDQRLAGLVEWDGKLHLVTRADDAVRVVPLGG